MENQTYNSDIGIESKDLIIDSNNIFLSSIDILNIPVHTRSMVSSIREIDNSKIKHIAYIYDHIFRQIESIDYQKHTTLNVNDEPSKLEQNDSMSFSNYINNLKLHTLKLLLNISNNKSYESKYLLPMYCTTEILKQNDQIKKLYIEHNINGCHDLSKRSNLNGIIMFELYEYLDAIIKTYDSEEKIIRQILVDLPRQDVYVNDMKINSVEQMLNDNRIFNRDIYFGYARHNTINILLLMMIMSCQSSFGTAFEFLSQKTMKYKIEKNNDMVLVDSNKRSVIRIHINNNDFKCSFEKKHRIIDTSTGNILHMINVETIIDITQYYGIVVYEQVNI
jgi:hypothetical protein